MEVKAIEEMRKDPAMRKHFLDKVAAPIANKLFECNMVPLSNVRLKPAFRAQTCHFCQFRGHDGVCRLARRMGTSGKGTSRRQTSEEVKGTSVRDISTEQ